jgi:S-DNA-T family DNA segregation ATPase FtsK/SpoIIIE
LNPPGPAAGIVLVLATQRPDTKTIPSALRAVLGSRFALRVMDWRDSNIILGEQMNTRGWDSSRLLPSHKGVGILRPDGETAAGADVLAMMVRTDYMPNNDWTTLCERGRALRAAAGTLTGHAIGAVSVPVLDPATVAHVIGPGQTTDDTLLARAVPEDLPEPLASVVEYLGADLEDGGREFVPTAELIDALDMEPAGVRTADGRAGLPATPRPGPERRRDQSAGARLPHRRHPDHDRGGPARRVGAWTTSQSDPSHSRPQPVTHGGQAPP